jgi:hypothetical protein
MSYVDLKHLLAELALEAIADPERAQGAAVSAAYGEIATGDALAVPSEPLYARAERFATRVGWRLSLADAAHLVARGLLDQRDATFTLKPQYVAHLAYLRQQTSRLLDALQFVKTFASAGMVTDLHRGVALFNAGLFFECHELLESVWKATTGPDKAFYHGIVQVAAAFYHYEKHNRHGAVTLMTKGLGKLAGYPDRHLGIEVEAFRKALQSWAASFETETKTNAIHPEMLPHIEFVER